MDESLNWGYIYVELWRANLLLLLNQKLDTKTLQRLEAAVAKSEYSQGKKLKVVTKVSYLFPTGTSLHYKKKGETKNRKEKRSNHLVQVNPDVLGGLIVEIGDRTIDLSVSAKIAKLNKALTDTL